jgi:hypothetical protein
MKEIIIFLILIFLGFVSAVKVDISCPDMVGVNEEFKCALNFINGDGVYDIKIEIGKDGKNIAKIWNPVAGKWGSAYYYLKEFIGDEEENIKLIILEEGDFNGVLKLRLGEKTESFDFEISVGNTDNEIKEEKSKEILQEEEVFLENKPIDKKNVILLGSFNTINNEGETVYESKNFKVMKYLPYVFCLFLILVIGFLVWDKF